MSLSIVCRKISYCRSRNIIKYLCFCLQQKQLVFSNVLLIFVKVCCTNRLPRRTMCGTFVVTRVCNKEYTRKKSEREEISLPQFWVRKKSGEQIVFTSSRKFVTALFLERTDREIGNRIKSYRAQLTSGTKVENANAN